MIGMREQRSLERDREHVMRHSSVGSIENRVTLNPLKYSCDVWHEGSGMVPTRTGPGADKFEGSLSFPLIRSAIRDYPDTGESGDAYDVEAHG